MGRQPRGRIRILVQVRKYGWFEICIQYSLKQKKNSQFHRVNTEELAEETTIYDEFEVVTKLSK